MTDLFPETINKGQHGATWQAGAWTVRNWRGYAQQREKGQRDWQFYVDGFSGPEDGNGIAHVLMIRADGTTCTAPHPIDRHNRITIMGRKYGRTHWDH